MNIFYVQIKLYIADMKWFYYSVCKYVCSIILNSVRQHNYFITQGIYIGYMFRLQIVIFRPIFAI